jgi:hypothetical protein
LLRAIVRASTGFLGVLSPFSTNISYGTKPTCTLNGLAIGNGIVKNGSNIILILLHVRH